MNIAPIQTFSFKNNLIKRTKNSPSFGDMNYGDEVTIISSKRKPKEVRVMSPEYDFLNAQFNLLHYKNSGIYDLGKKFMQDGWTMRFTSKALQDKAQEISKNSIEKFDEAIVLFEDAKLHDFKEYRNHNRSEYWSRREAERDWQGITITEYDDDDESEVLRKVKITDSKVIYEDVRYGSGLIDEYVFDKETKQLLKLTLGKNEFILGGYKAEEQYEYDSEGNLFTYFKNYKITKNADESAQAYFVFSSGIISKYYQNYFDGGEKHAMSASIILDFIDGSCCGVDLDYKDVEDGKKTISRQYLFDTHGNIDACACNLVEEQNRLITAPTIYTYTSGILDKIMTGYKAFKDNSTATAQKIFDYEMDDYQRGTCTLKNMGTKGENYKINNCMSERIATFYKG